MNGLRTLIDFVNGTQVEIAPGVTLGVESPVCLTPVVSLVGEMIRIGFPQWLPVLVEVSALSPVLFPIVDAIAKNHPVEIEGRWIDFHGQLPRITPHPLQSCFVMSWLKAPKIDVRFVPNILDPVIQSIGVYPTGLQINGNCWSKWVEL